MLKVGAQKVKYTIVVFFPAFTVQGFDFTVLSSVGYTLLEGG